MANHGGKRAGAGRPPKTVAKMKKGSLDPLDYLQGIVDDDKKDQALRIDCAKAIARFYHPILAATDQTNHGEVEIIHKIERTIVKP